MRYAGGKEHQFRRLVAGVVGAVPEMHARAAQCPLAAIDRRADGFGSCVG